MDFYQMIGHYYDDLFPPSQAQISFLLKQLEKPSKILDLGCATGGYAIALAEQGHEVTAIDLDEAMIEILAHKIKDKPYKLDSQVADIRAVASMSETYDLIYCIGNTIVHLDNLDEVDSFLSACYARLNSGGKLVIQSVNYDRILKNQVQSLPEIVREYPALSFFRRYHHEEGHIRFVGALTVGESGQKKTWTAETQLLPILKNDLEQSFIKIGFEQIDFYGDFTKVPFSIESPALVTLTVK
jgi:glycine/sarcosine N-methyltransferase